MNKMTKNKIGIKRKDNFNKKLALQVMFSIMLVSAVIISKNFDTTATRKFISTTEEKFTQNLDPSGVTDAIKNLYVNVKNKIPFISDTADGGAYSAPVNGKIYTKYGMTKDGDVTYYNHGVDILSNTESVKSISKGTVVTVGNNDKLSNYIIVQDDDKRVIYGKINETLVSQGDNISKGDIIGALNEKEKILHLEIWENGESLNPTKLFDIKN